MVLDYFLREHPRTMCTNGLAGLVRNLHYTPIFRSDLIHTRITYILLRSHTHTYHLYLAQISYTYRLDLAHISYIA